MNKTGNFFNKPNRYCKNRKTQAATTKGHPKILLHYYMLPYAPWQIWIEGHSHQTVWKNGYSVRKLKLVQLWSK